ncbi:MAG: family 20 glycosylhydrolase [Chitinophagaceae bacterium]
MKKVKTATTNCIRFNTIQPIRAGVEGAYVLEATGKQVQIQGQTASGTFAGMQTLIQLLPVEVKTKSLSIPQVTVRDYPRFGYRGMHLDCGRHFWSVDFVKKYIDYLALHKFNTFHWHLTEDQGWRIEIKKYPKLTQAGAWRTGTITGNYPGTGNDGKKYGGYYTQQQIREVVKYAADRFITIIPEIEMPGHSSAAIAAYPELSCFPEEPTISFYPKACKWSGDSTGKKVQQTWGVFDDVFCAGRESTFTFIENVLNEVLTLFPSRYIHVGGDECPKENWVRCEQCQLRIKSNHLKDEHELQSYFIQRVEKYLNGKGRTLIGWDEILEGGLAPNAVVMSWRGEQGGIDAAKQNHDVIMTPGNPVYFDHSQSENEDSLTIGGYNPLEKVYAYEPVPAALTEEQGKHVLGAQANMWTEYMDNPKKVEYMLFPRIAALSEVLWSDPKQKDWSDFEKRLMVQFKRYDAWKANYSKAYFDLKAAVIPSDDHTAVLWKLESRLPDAGIRFSAGSSSVDTAYTSPVRITSSALYTARSYFNNKVAGAVSQAFHFNIATGKPITLATPPSSNYPGDGAFTLVNGIINEKGMARSKEFLGFLGTNCEAVIDLGTPREISFVVVNCLRRESSWIWPATKAEVMGSDDGQKWFPLKYTDQLTEKNDNPGKVFLMLPFRKTFARYVKVIATSQGTIPPGYPGAGNNAWLFVDEIEVE